MNTVSGLTEQLLHLQFPLIFCRLGCGWVLLTFLSGLKYSYWQTHVRRIQEVSASNLIKTTV